MIDLKIIHLGQPSPSDRSFAKLAGFMGVPSSFVPAVSAVPASIGDDRRNILLAGTLEAIGPLLQDPHALDRVKAVFLYSPNRTPACLESLATLSEGAISGFTPANDAPQKLSFPPKREDVTFQFSGLEFEYPAEGVHSTFQTVTPNLLRTLLNLDGSPYFIECRFQGADILLLGAAEITDIDSPFLKGRPVMQNLKGFIPAMMFLRKYAGSQCWHPSAFQATLVIDDPLVRPRYGHVDFAELLNAMERRHYAATLAFIPWNYRRSNPKTASLFQRHSDRLSIAVHGCDHNAREFGVTDEAQLCWKGKTALERMGRHSQAFHANFDKIMVFPQGIFSSVSMAALQRCGFDAVANATPHPVDKPIDFLCMRDMLECALTRFSNFALFLRRSHQSVPIAAFDLFLGRPVIFFAHHQDFRDRGEEIGVTAERVNALPGPVRWATLGHVCARAGLQRFDDDGNLHIRTYTDRFVAQNPTQKQQPCFIYRAAGSDKIVSALVDGRPTECVVDAGFVRISCVLDPGASADIRIERGGLTCRAEGYRQTVLEKASIFLRRHLSEFRANFVDTLDFGRTDGGK